MRSLPALAAWVAVLAASPATAASWDMSCLSGGRTVYAERLGSEPEAKASAGRGRARFPEAICIVSDATPSDPTPLLDEIRARGSSSGPPGSAQDDLTSALMALAGETVPTAPPLVLPLASDHPPGTTAANEPPPFVPVIPDPAIAADHVRIAVYENVPIGIVVSDFERIRSEVPSLGRYVPMIETSPSGRTFVDVGPVAPLPMDDLCASLEDAGSRCVRSPAPEPVCARTSLPRDLVAAAVACRPEPETPNCPLVRYGAIGPDPLRDVLFLASTVR